MAIEIKNAVIQKAEICDSDRGLLDCWLTLNYGDSGQGFGGFALYLPKGFSNHKIESVAGHHIWRCMEVAGVKAWSKMEGKTIRARVVSGMIEGIGHIVKDDWFIPADDYKMGEEQ